MESADKHSPRQDDRLKHDTEGMVRSGHSTRAEEWHDPEPAGEDEPAVSLGAHGTLVGGTPDGMTEEDVARRTQLASYLSRTAFPATRERLVEDAQTHQAPDDVLAELSRLPADQNFVNVGDVWTALGGGAEAHRF